MRVTPDHSPTLCCQCELHRIARRPFVAKARDAAKACDVDTSACSAAKFYWLRRNRGARAARAAALQAPRPTFVHTPTAEGPAPGGGPL
eukprot:4893790-Pyramimonas_sp.AAC.1